MPENELSRQSVKIPLDLIAEAAPYMTRQGYKFQGLLLELFESWLGQQKAKVANGSAAHTPQQHKKTVFDELMEIDPQSASEFARLLQTAVKRAKELENARPVGVVPPAANAGAGTATSKTKTR